MNKPIAEIEVVSSQLGNQWLAQMKAAAPGVFVEAPQSANTLPEVVFDFGNHPARQRIDSDNSSDDTLVNNPATDEMPPIDNPLDSNCDESLPTVAECEDTDETSSDIDESSPQPVVADAEIECVADQILKRFDGETNIVVVVAGCQQGFATGETCTRIAGALAQRQQGSVLLIDSEVDAKTMTNQCGLQEEEGLANFLAGQSDWESNLFNQEELPLAFLSAGNTDLQVGHRSKTNVKRLVNEARNQFRFVCVSTGEAHNPGAELWMSSCSGSYLVVDLQQSNKTVARSALKNFQDAGTEVLGCLVTNAT